MWVVEIEADMKVYGSRKKKDEIKNRRIFLHRISQKKISILVAGRDTDLKMQLLGWWKVGRVFANFEKGYSETSLRGGGGGGCHLCDIKNPQRFV